MKLKSETDTPDLDKALLDAEALLSSYPTRKQIADAFLEQRAEEAERCAGDSILDADMFRHHRQRAADLRRQSGGMK